MNKRGIQRLSVFLIIVPLCAIILGCTHRTTDTPSSTTSTSGPTLTTRVTQLPSIASTEPADKVVDISINAPETTIPSLINTPGTIIPFSPNTPVAVETASTKTPETIPPSTTRNQTVKKVTVYDSDLPLPPVAGMTFHFITPAQGDPGPGKIRASYGFMTYSIWFGVENSRLWVYHLPRRETFPQLAGFYDSLGIEQYTTYNEADGKYRFDEIPPWLNVAKYDPNITRIPSLVSTESGEGNATVYYIVND
jgi:hypothetical protein